MAFTEGGFIQLPPDSTGKKSAAAGRIIIDYESETAPNLFEKFQTVTGGTSGATGQIVGKNTTGLAAGEGQLFVETDTLTGTFQTGEDLQVSAVTFATVKSNASLDTIYYQKQVVVDRDYPDRALKLDDRGDVYTRFDEGSPALSTFGSLLVDSLESIGQYIYAYDRKDKDFYDASGVGGSLSFLPNERAMLYDTNSTASGAYVHRTSNLYHQYQPGSMLKVMQTMALGDTGKVGLRRRWGYFDDENGIFWEQDDGIMYVVVRSNTSGSVIDTRVAQSNWNRDAFDGSIDFNLDVTKANLYWMDLQWLGVGVVRFGTYKENGIKTTCHVFEHPNQENTSYMRQGTLPVRWEVENKTTTASSSEMRSICTVVKNAGQINRQVRHFSCGPESGATVTDSDGEVPILSFRPKTTVNGLPNHSATVLEELHLASEGNGIFKLRVRENATLDGESFNSLDDASHTELDLSATGFASSGTNIYSAALTTGSYAHNFLDRDDDFKNTIDTYLSADQTTQPIVTISVEALSTGASGDFYATFNLKELHY